MDDITLRLIANPTNLKKKKYFIKNEYLKLYLNDVFKTDNNTINNLIIYIDNIIKNIDLDTFIIHEKLQDIISKIENENVY
jgi:hypothetical protein